MKNKILKPCFVKTKKSLREKLGLHLDIVKTIDLEEAIINTANKFDYKTLKEFCDIISVLPNTSKEIQHLISLITVGETYFFRHFRAIIENILPELIQKNIERKVLRIWSAGVSTGEEAYSLAMALYSLLPSNEEWNIQILATDINFQSLDFAKEGLYSSWSFRQTDQNIVRQFFEKKAGNTYKIKDFLRKNIIFSYHNLMDNNFPSFANGTAALDLILCRNVTIYFDLPVVQEIIKKFHEALNDNGYLIVGHSEPSIEIFSDYKSHIFNDMVVFQKKTEKIQKNEQETEKKEFGFKRKYYDKIFNQALEDFHEKNYEKAKQNFKRCLNSSHNNNANFYLSIIYANVQDYSSAENILQKLVKEAFCLGDVYYLFGLVNKEKGKNTKAVEYFQKSIRYDKKYLLSYFELLQLFNVKNEKKMTEFYRKKIKECLKDFSDDHIVGIIEQFTVEHLKQLIAMI